MAPKISRKELLEYKIPKSAVPWSPWPVLILIIFFTLVSTVLYLYLTNPWFCYGGSVFKNKACVNFYDSYYHFLFNYSGTIIYLLALLFTVLIVRLYGGKIWHIGIYPRGNKLFFVYLALVPVGLLVAILLNMDTVFFIDIAIVAPFTEEVVFRGLLFPALARRIGVGKGLVFTSLVFAIMPGHVVQGLVVVMLIFVTSEIFCLWYVRYKTLWPSILFHSFLNTKAFFAIGIKLQSVL